ncbi:MAG TPA: PQQ-binding-like beta-propeller repeat protein [Urbifossiella sp.]|nr:PQQ-binding-like beta-propeller repeat protein [Urbifossiella sp.]
MFRAAALALLSASAVVAADWPAWRGPTGQGHADEPNVPLKWSPKENIKWKVPLAHQGNSTPVVWKDSIFLTQATKGGGTRSLLCLSRADGSTRWQKDVAYPEKERNWNENWYANASPATDGERVVVSFASAGMYCFDFAGKELWKRTDLGTWQHKFGSGASPVLHGDLAILWCGPDENKGRNYLLAVDKRTGKTVWEHDEPVGSWGTPLVAKVNGQDQLIIGLSKDVKTAPEEKHGHLKGYDPATGSELWSARGLNSHVYTSPLVADGVVVGMSGYYGAAMAVKLGGKGDITKDRLWVHPKNAQRVGSGVIVGGHVYQVDEDGQPHRYDLRTGADAWADEQKLKGGQTWGSLVHAGGRLYLLMRNGTTAVLSPTEKYEVLALNPLGAGEQTNSSPVVVGGEVYLRTFRHLWCVAEKK